MKKKNYPVCKKIVKYNQEKGICQCGEQGGCKCCSKSICSNPPAMCIQKNNIEKTHSHNHFMYHCNICDIDICASCCSLCHREHDTIYIGKSTEICLCAKNPEASCCLNNPHRTNRCSFGETGFKPVLHCIYHCIDCGIVGKDGFCEACAKICHKGHKVKKDLEFQNTICKCHLMMPEGQQCISLTPELQCTEISHPDEYVSSKGYRCLDCEQNQGCYICEACKNACHRGHNVIFVGQLKNYFCACGNNLMMKPNHKCLFFSN